MNSDEPMRSTMLTPTRIIAVLAVCVALAAGAVFVAWTAGPQTITLEVSQPVGRTVLCHFVVDGTPESHEDTIPVTYRFEAHQLRYAVIGRDLSPSAEVTVTLRDRTGTGGVSTASGVKGGYTSNWWGSASQIEAMTPTHVETMRKSVIAEGQTGGNAGHEVRAP